jgi:hypothetical protein
VAGLSRPYIFIESVSHNFSEWRSGNEQLRFVFHLVNHGTGPAIIKTIFAYATLSHGPGSERENEPTPRPFPEKDRLLQTICPPWGMVFMCPADESRRPEKVKSFVLPAGETSQRFKSVVPFPPLEMDESVLGWQMMRKMYEMTAPDGPVSPWLFIHIYYETPFGTGHITNFCALGFSSGGILEYEEAPYSDRT